MLLFLLIGIIAGIGIALGIRSKKKGLVRTSLMVLIVDVAVFIAGSILYAFFE